MEEELKVIIVSWLTAGTEGVNFALEALTMAKKLDPHRDTARMAVEPWLIEAALTRLGDRHLTPAEQRVVLAAARTPGKVNWPHWWTELPGK